MQDEDETVDVESYGEETSNGAINMTSQLYNNNNNVNNNNINNSNSTSNPSNNNNQITNNNHLISKTDKTPEEHTITSLSSANARNSWEHKNRLNLNLNCTPISDNGITRVTPTSSDQRIDVEYELDHDREQSQDRMTDNDEEVIVDNTDDESDMGMKRKIQNLSQTPPSQVQRSNINNLRDIKKR